MKIFFCQNNKNWSTFSRKSVIKLLKYGFGIRDPGSKRDRIRNTAIYRTFTLYFKQQCGIKIQHNALPDRGAQINADPDPGQVFAFSFPLTLNRYRTGN